MKKLTEKLGDGIHWKEKCPSELKRINTVFRYLFRLMTYLQLRGWTRCAPDSLANSL